MLKENLCTICFVISNFRLNSPNLDWVLTNLQASGTSFPPWPPEWPLRVSVGCHEAILKLGETEPGWLQPPAFSSGWTLLRIWWAVTVVGQSQLWIREKIQSTNPEMTTYHVLEMSGQGKSIPPSLRCTARLYWCPISCLDVFYYGLITYGPLNAQCRTSYNLYQAPRRS